MSASEGGLRKSDGGPHSRNVAAAFAAALQEAEQGGKCLTFTEQGAMQAPPYQLCEERTGRIVVARLEIARSLWQQTVGLLGRKGLPSDGGMWLEPCNSIHTFGMQFAIDVLFLDAAGRLVRSVAGLRPWRICLPVWKARVVVELPEGAIARWNIQPGNRYHIVGNS